MKRNDIEIVLIGFVDSARVEGRYLFLLHPDDGVLTADEIVFPVQWFH